MVEGWESKENGMSEVKNSCLVIEIQSFVVTRHRVKGFFLAKGVKELIFRA